MNQAQFDDLDAFLATAEVTGKRFEVPYWAGGTYYTPGPEGGCAMVCFARNRGYPADAKDGSEYDAALAAFDRFTAEYFGVLCHMGPGPQRDVFHANNSTGGDPKAVRAKLHELFPEFAKAPSGKAFSPPVLTEESSLCALTQAKLVSGSEAKREKRSGTDNPARRAP